MFGTLVIILFLASLTYFGGRNRGREVEGLFTAIFFLIIQLSVMQHFEHIFCHKAILSGVTLEVKC